MLESPQPREDGEKQRRMDRSTGKQKVGKGKAASLTLSAVFGAVLLAGSNDSAQALGFGRPPTTATLGQPLDLAIPIRLDSNEDLTADCVAAEVRFSDNRQQAGVINVALDRALPGASERILRITTNTRVDEPIVTVDVSAGCGGKISRSFTLLADPPLVTAEAPVVAAPVVAAPEPAPARSVASPATPRAPAVTSGGQATEGAPAPRRSTRPARRTTPATSAGAVAAAQPSATAPRPSSSAQPTANAARLRLTPFERGARVDSQAQAQAAAASAAEAERAADAQRAASAVEAAASARERVEQLEAALAKMRAETDQAQQNVKGLQARLQSAESSRFSNPLVYGLGAASLLLLAALFWMWRQREQERAQRAWLVSSHGARDSGTSADIDTEEAIAFAPNDRPTTQAGAFISAPTPLGTSMSTGPGAFDPLSTVVLRGPSGLQAQPAKREVSAEELIDLEQQAEFFMVLGQEEAAIDLLMGHLRSTAGTSPLPYLKLLEIYKKRGERKEYERTRERFNSRFNAYAPSWETDLLEGRSLEDYPTVLDEIVRQWPQSGEVLETLQATLVRRDDEADGADSFDLPAYRELMLLYAVARDHAENPSETTPTAAAAAVDLLLPLDDMPVLERLMSTTPVTAQPGARPPLHVDVPLDLASPDSDLGKLTLEFPPTQVEDDEPPKPR